MLVKEVIPQQLSRRQLARQLAAEREKRRKLFVGRPLHLPLTAGTPLAFYEVCDDVTASSLVRLLQLYSYFSTYQPNPAADAKAASIVQERGVTHVRWAQHGEIWQATAIVKASGVLNQAYSCTVFPYDQIRCDCMDFRARGGLCKHLRAAFIQVVIAETGVA